MTTRFATALTLQRSSRAHHGQRRRGAATTTASSSPAASSYSSRSTSDAAEAAVGAGDSANGAAAAAAGGEAALTASAPVIGQAVPAGARREKGQVGAAVATKTGDGFGDGFGEGWEGVEVGAIETCIVGTVICKRDAMAKEALAKLADSESVQRSGGRRSMTEVDLQGGRERRRRRRRRCPVQ